MSDPEFYNMIAKAPIFEAVIKGAIAVEVEIEEAFSLNFIDFDSLVQMRLTYEQKVKLMVAIGLEPRFEGPLKALAKIRNRFAHNLDADFSASDADNFYSTFSKEDRKIIDLSLEAMEGRIQEGENHKQFSEFDIQDKFSLCVVTLRSAMKATHAEIRAKLK